MADVVCGCEIVQSIAVNSMNGSMLDGIGDTPADGFCNDIIRSFHLNRVFSHVKRALFRVTLYLCSIFALMP